MRWVGSWVIALAALAGCVAVVYGVVGRGAPVTQPISFNHAVHVGEASLACVDCHTDAGTCRDAGLPGKQVCLDCHDVDEEQGAHPEKDKLFAYDKTDGDIPWVRVAMTRPDVYFSHQRHVGSGKLDCLVCHADQPTLDKPPPTARLVMSMADCIECHEENRATSDCLACHR